MKNRLFPISLRGVGTADVESFASYLHRTSYEHGAGVGELIRHAYKSEAAYIPVSGSECIPRKYLTVRELVTPNEETVNLTRLFETLTTQKLYSGVLWVLDVAIGRSLGEVSKGFRWCPECFSEMNFLNEDAYFKLMWHMTAISHCSIHRTILVSQCFKCGSDQSTYVKGRAMSLCQNCGGGSL